MKRLSDLPGRLCLTVFESASFSPVLKMARLDEMDQEASACSASSKPQPIWWTFRRASASSCLSW